MPKFIATFEKEEIPVEFEQDAGLLKVKSGDQFWDLDCQRIGPDHYSVVTDGRSYDLRFVSHGDKTDVFFDGKHLEFLLEDERSHARKKIKKGASGAAGVEGPAEITSMMPGKIVAVKVRKGDKVAEGQGVVVLEAMKMENELASPKEGIVADVRVSTGQSVESGVILVVIE